MRRVKMATSLPQPPTMATPRRLVPTIVSAAFLAAASTRVGAQTAELSPLPSPTGEHPVGRTSFDWVDETRPDPVDSSKHREIVVWVWYPATSRSDSDPAEWMPGKWGEEFWSEYSRSRAGAAVNRGSAISTIRSHANADAAADSSGRRYPVLLFAAGPGTTPLDYAAVVEDVASHGYIVVGVVSPDFARATVFADGRVVQGHDPVHLATLGGQRPTTALAIRAFEDAARSYGKDLSFALTRLSTARRGALAGRADLARVGVFGHSLGGAAALQCAHDDPRVRAVFDIDGSPIWNPQNGALRKPVLVLSAASTNVDYRVVLDGATPGRHLRVAGTVHTFSSDMRMMPFVPQGVSNPQNGATTPARALRITARYLEAFFDRYLDGRREPLLDGPSADYPEVTFERLP